MSFTSLYISFVLSAIGFAYLTYGRKAQRFQFVLSGIVIMVYSYFIGSVLVMLIVGAILMALPFVLGRFMR